MKAKEKRMILILVVITIIMLIITIIVKNNNRKNNEIQQGNLVEQREDGTKESISNKLKEEKTLEDLSVTNISFRDTNN